MNAGLSLLTLCVCSFVYFFEDAQDPNRVTNNTRKLGLVVVRGTQISLVCPDAGTEEIANPFLGADEDDEDDPETN